MIKTQWCVISYDEWFPYYDLYPIENTLDARDTDVVIELTEDDYLVYKGLLTQIERLQNKLEKLHHKAIFNPKGLKK